MLMKNQLYFAEHIINDVINDIKTICNDRYHPLCEFYLYSDTNTTLKVGEQYLLDEIPFADASKWVDIYPPAEIRNGFKVVCSGKLLFDVITCEIEGNPEASLTDYLLIINDYLRQGIYLELPEKE